MHLSIFVDITEGSTDGAHTIAIGDVGEFPLEHRSQAQHVVQSAVAAWRSVHEGDRALEIIASLLQVLGLPNPPYTIDLRVVEEESLSRSISMGPPVPRTILTGSEGELKKSVPASPPTV